MNEETDHGSELHRLLTAAVARDLSEQEREAAFLRLSRLAHLAARATMTRGDRQGLVVESMDISQSVVRGMIGALEAGKLSFDSEAHLLAYLKRTVRSKLLDTVRKRRGRGRERANVVPLDDASGHEPSGPTAERDPRSLVAGEEELERVARAIACRSEREQTIVRLRLAGKSWRSVATELGLSEEAVKQVYSRLLRNIKRELDADPT